MDAHLASGFSTTYPDQLSNYCAEAVWSNFINDINTAAKCKSTGIKGIIFLLMCPVKAKDRFVIRLRPVLRHIKGLGKALDIQLEKRTTPILDVLQYWRGLIDSKFDSFVVIDSIRHSQDLRDTSRAAERWRDTQEEANSSSRAKEEEIEQKS